MSILNILVKSAAKKSVIRVTGSVIANTAGHVIVDTAKGIVEIMDSRPPASYIKIPYAHNHFLGEHFEAVKAEFIGFGFLNITVIPIRDFKYSFLSDIFSTSKNGLVDSVAINGNYNFKKKAKFNPNAAVVIKYHAY